MPKNVFIILMLNLSLFNVLIAQDRANMILTVAPKSELTIIGKTNVNTFTCRYTEVMSDTLNIEVIRNKGDYMIDNAEMTFHVSAFDCGNAMMNEDFKDLLNADEFPVIRVNFKSLYMTPGQSKEIMGSIIAQFELAGTEGASPINILKKPEKSQTNDYFGFTNLDITNFGLEPPTKMMGMIKVKKDIKVEFDLNVIVLQPLQALSAK